MENIEKTESKYNNGETVKVTANTGFHNFEIGAEIKLLFPSYCYDENYRWWLAKSVVNRWTMELINESDFETLKQ